MRAIAIALLLAGCRVTEHFACERDSQCTYGTTRGACTPNGCAFADASCASGFRYDETATDEVAEECTGGGATPGCTDWNPLHFDACALPQPLGAFTLSAGTYFYDTDRGELTGGDVPTSAPPSIVIPQTNPPGPSIRVLSVQSFMMEPASHLQVSGTYPFVIASWSTATAFGNITVSSSLSLLGAGANPDDCDAKTGTDNGAGGGGGANQGDGGTGGSSTDPVATGGAGGTKRAAALIVGGCKGATSGLAGSFAKPPATAMTFGAGGNGGGAIQITARERVDAVSINANGGGGFGSPYAASSGGGGGGAGGYIGLEAPIVSIGGGLFANGGGGGGGADNSTSGGFGQSGNGGTSAAAGGTAGTGCGSVGGTGAASTTLAGGNGGALDKCGAGAAHGSTGGGGGGAGFVVIKSPMLTKATSA